MVCVYIYIHTYIHTHNGILLSHIKECSFAICNNMDGAVDDLTNSGNLETKRHMSQDITYMWSLKRDTKDPRKYLKR